MNVPMPEQKPVAMSDPGAGRGALKLFSASVADAREITCLELRSAEFECRSFPLPPYKDLLAIWRRRIGREGYKVILARAGTRLAGFTALTPPLTQGHMLALYVDPDFFRMQVGSLLVQAAAQILRNNGAKQLQLEVQVHNYGAQAFYRTLHFMLSPLQSTDQLLCFYKEL